MLIAVSSTAVAHAQPAGCCDSGPPTPEQQRFIDDMRGLGATSSDINLRGAANGLCFIIWGRPDMASVAIIRRQIEPVDWETARSLAVRDYCATPASVGL